MAARFFFGLRVSLLLLAMLLTLGACSRAGLAYRNLDVIIPWTLSDYLAMKRPQKAWLDDRLKEHLRWHCTTQLPIYLTWLDKVRALAKNGDASEAQLQTLTAQAKQAIASVAKEITPSTVELLRDLNDEQVSDMQKAFDKDNRERREKFVEPPLPKQISERAERMEKRLTPWLGELTDAQSQRVQQWSAALGAQNVDWVANRARWQEQFMSAVKQRKNADFSEQIERLLQDRESLWTPQYREVYAHIELEARHLVIDLLHSATPDQRERFLDKLDDLRHDFAELDCLKASKAVLKAR